MIIKKIFLYIKNNWTAWFLIIIILVSLFFTYFYDLPSIEANSPWDIILLFSPFLIPIVVASMVSLLLNSIFPLLVNDHYSWNHMALPSVIAYGGTYFFVLILFPIIIGLSNHNLESIGFGFILAVTLFCSCGVLWVGIGYFGQIGININKKIADTKR